VTGEGEQHRTGSGELTLHEGRSDKALRYGR